ncbi:MAG: FAD-dependent oxidoreductase, partial [Pseudomonadota bacterium]
TPLTPHLAAAGAHFGPVNGWERAQYYAAPGDPPDAPGFGWTPAEAAVAREVAAVSTRAGIMEVGGFTRLAVRGEGGIAWLDGLLAGRVPKRVGRVGLAYYLTGQGNVAGEVTVARLDERTVWLGAAAAAHAHDLDWFTRQLPADGSVALDDLTESHLALVLAGPRARE